MGCGAPPPHPDMNIYIRSTNFIRNIDNTALAIYEPVEESQWKQLDDFRDSTPLSLVREEPNDDVETTVVLRSHDEDVLSDTDEADDKPVEEESHSDKTRFDEEEADDE